MTGHRHAHRTATTAVGATLALLVAGAPGAAAQEVSTPRLAGENRFQTAVEIAAQRLAGDDQSIETVLLARSDDFPDALSAAGLAGHVGGTADISAPVLLTEGNRLTPATREALRRFSTRRVVLLGGPSAISSAVEAQLDRDHDVTRVAGDDRYATAAEAARRLVANTRGLSSIGGQSTVIVASGVDFADALAGGPVAYAAKVPILLTAPDALPGSTAAVLDELDPDQAIVLGGEAAVSPAVRASIEQRGIATRRIGGANRQETAARIADFALRELGFDASDVVLARGDAFPDALAGAPEAGRTQAPVLLTRTPAALGAPAEQWLQSRRNTIETVRILGGSAAVTAATAQQAAQAAGSGGSQQPFPADTSPDTATASADARLNVVDMEFGRHEGFDRIVLELTGTGSPGWTVEYVETPREQGSGNTVALRGDAYLQADITGVILPTAPGGQPYEGPEEIVPRTSEVILEAQMGSSFEGHREAFLGLASRQPFRVFSLENPTRIVLDVQHGDDAATTDQAFLVAPQEALTSSVGAMREFRVLSRYEGQAFTGPVDVALFPCSVDATGAGPVVFPDANGDGQADRLGQSDTGAARIIGVNGTETNTTTARGVGPGSDGTLHFHVNAMAADCTVPVVFDDETDDGQLAVDAQGRGTEPFAVGKITWQ